MGKGKRLRRDRASVDEQGGEAIGETAVTSQAVSWGGVGGQSVRLPAVCGKCGRTFPSLYAVGPGTTGIVFDGNTSGPCPHCGGMGHVPDGTFSFQAAAESAIRGATTAEREALFKALQELPEGASGAEVAASLDEASARWKAIADFIRPKHASQVAGYLGFLYMLFRIFGVAP